MGHLSQTRVLVSLTKLQVNRVESHPPPTNATRENLPVCYQLLWSEFAASGYLKRNCGENCEKKTEKHFDWTA